MNTVSLPFLQELALNFTEDDYFLMVARKDETIISFCLFLIEGEEAVYYQGATDFSFVKTGISSELMFESFVALSDRNITSVNMNGLGDPGVRKWKESFNLNVFDILVYEKSGTTFRILKKIYELF